MPIAAGRFWHDSDTLRHLNTGCRICRVTECHILMVVSQGWCLLIFGSRVKTYLKCHSHLPMPNASPTWMISISRFSSRLNFQYCLKEGFGKLNQSTKGSIGFNTLYIPYSQHYACWCHSEEGAGASACIMLTYRPIGLTVRITSPTWGSKVIEPWAFGSIFDKPPYM